uniref:Uncharacterized protein n=1 Tax=Oryza barthii TaxID=65489 RepID=A0A0D3GF47_9ORYZ
MAGASGERPASNWDWSDCDAAFTEEADGAIAALQDTGGDGSPPSSSSGAAWMAPCCLHIAFALAFVLIEMGSFDEADMACAHSLLVPDLTNPAHNFISPKEQVDAIISSKAPEYRLGRRAI